MLLDDVDKLFEHIIANRLIGYLEGTGPDLTCIQDGFWRGRPTIDVISHVKVLTQEAVSTGEVVLAVSLDIAIVFTLPYSCVKEALHYH